MPMSCASARCAYGASGIAGVSPPMNYCSRPNHRVPTHKRWGRYLPSDSGSSGPHECLVLKRYTLSEALSFSALVECLMVCNICSLPQELENIAEPYLGYRRVSASAWLTQARHKKSPAQKWASIPWSMFLPERPGVAPFQQWNPCF